jgi:hypothetical protein
MVNGGITMTSLLQQAFDQAASLPEAEQDLLAAWLLAQLAGEDQFDREISDSAPKLAGMAKQAIADYRAGMTEELDPERL